MFYVVLCVAASFNRSTDESALLAFKSQINDPNKILSWSQGIPFCSWIGITCGRKHQRVVGINVSHMGLGGTIAKEIGKLTFLKSLDISNNSFHDFIPDEIGNISRLQEIKMQYNELNGQIPSSFGFLKNLQKLNLSGNAFTGDIPNMVFNLSSLVEIDLGNNRLSGSLPMDICSNLPKLEILEIPLNQIGGIIPPSLGGCTKLKQLSLKMNNLRGGIPMEIGNLPQLQILFLEKNNLTGSIPDSIGNLSTLRLLDMGYNGFTGTIPISIGNLSNLEVFGVANNNIQGYIPSELGSLSNLIWLDFSYNKLEGEIPESIFNLTKLQIINLVSNYITGNLPSIVDRLHNLRYIALGFNKLSGEIPSSISNISNLILLALGYNSFSGPVPVNLGNLQNLQFLGLAGDQLTNDPSMSELGFLISLRNCRHLKYISIGSNSFDAMLPKSFSLGNLSASLEKFEANSCGIRGTIPNEIGNLSNLISLHMGSNKLRGRIPETLGELKKMQSLAIDNNKLEGPIPVSFCKFENLYSIILEKNELSQEIPGCLGNLTSLRMVNLSFNRFTSTIPSLFWTNKDLAIVDLSYNLLGGSLPLEIGSVTGMRELYLLGNRFTGDIPSSIWGRLQSLEFLILAENKLHGHIPETFANLIALQSLNLSQNNLSGVIPKSLESLRNLVYFNVSFNDLSGEIPNGGFFKNLKADSFKGNRELCGASQFEVFPCKGNKSSCTRFLKYIVPPAAFVVALVIILMVCLVRRGKSSTPLPPQSSFPFAFGDNRISYHEIVKATNGFGKDNLIDRGSIGSVYKGIFSNGIVAAIKVFDLDMEDANKSFDVECHIMSNIRHRNLVKVINSCCNLDIKALVLEYMPNGNLNNWLYSCDSGLNIAQRMEIMMNVADALEYLHHGYPSPIVHCDLKPSNILLDEDMVARVGDFGIAKLFTKDQRISLTKTLGTIGYMAPEYGSRGLISTMADVYSYGILLMEVLTRKKPTDDIFVGELTMRRWVFESFPDAIMQIVDVDVLKGEENVNARESCLKLLMGLALECTVDLPEERLNMEEVVVRLKKIKNEFLS
ncbi:unnamed protein product [Fraxinus pennsylvanica]|uniref:non-specific serine/threonine protein kinase n=1 Tax=Fraxinus pennsylvanica TaxID=56036 RepID=A0AAD2EE39_9LAMI|nr:unnamed protein product [Fraxinus pennsylvanica]